MEALKLFKDYEPIRSIYETEDEYICVPEREKAEPLVIFYDKKLGQYETKFFYEDKDNSISDAIENGTLIYGQPMNYRD